VRRLLSRTHTCQLPPRPVGWPPDKVPARNRQAVLILPKVQRSRATDLRGADISVGPKPPVPANRAVEIPTNVTTRARPRAPPESKSRAVWRAARSVNPRGGPKGIKEKRQEECRSAQRLGQKWFPVKIAASEGLETAAAGSQAV